MGKYQEFVKAMEETENARAKLSARILLQTCQKYYSTYLQYEKLIELDKYFSQIYTTKDGKPIPKEGNLSFQDKQVLCFLVAYLKDQNEKANAEDNKIIEKTKKQMIDASEVQKEQLREEIAVRKGFIAERNRTNTEKDYLLSLVVNKEKMNKTAMDICFELYILEDEGEEAAYEGVHDIDRDSELLGIIVNAVDHYVSVLNKRLEKKGVIEQVGKSDYEKVIRQSDIDWDADSLDEKEAIFLESKKCLNISQEEAFETVFSDEYIDDILEELKLSNDPVWAAHFGISTIIAISRFTHEEMKRTDNDKYFKMKFTFSFPDLEQKRNILVEKCEYIFKTYHLTEGYVSEKRGYFMNMEKESCFEEDVVKTN